MLHAREAAFPAPFPHGLEYSPPCRGTWNIVHTGMLVPESHQIFICASGCLRGVVLTAAEMGLMGRFSSIELRETDLTGRDNERLILAGVADILARLPERPRVVLLFPACVHHFLGCNLRYVYRELRAKYPDIDFAECFMDPIRQTRHLTPEERLRRGVDAQDAAVLVEQDKALERRFQKVMVDEPSQEDAISILRGLKERYENHHQVRIKDEAIVAAVELSTRYITSRFLPDKAIDLVDEAASRLRLEMNSVPEEIDTLDRRVRQLEIEREAIRREKDKERVEHLTKEIEELKARDAEMRARWQGQRDLLKKIQANKDKIESLKVEAQQAERQGDYGKVAEIRYGKIQEAEKEIAAFQEEYRLASASGSMIKEEVDAQDVAEVVSRWTGIPVTRMLASEREKLLHIVAAADL